jgi:hypothetical protein
VVQPEPIMEIQPDIEHYGPEDMAAMGYPELQTANDLLDLPDDELVAIMSICGTEPLDLECIPCMAAEILNGRADARADQSADGWLKDVEQRAVAEALKPRPEFKQFAPTTDVGSEPTPNNLLELVDQLHAIAHGTPMLTLTEREMVVLIVGCSKWVEQIDARLAEGFGLTEVQQAAVAEARELVTRIRRQSDAAYAD